MKQATLFDLPITLELKLNICRIDNRYFYNGYEITDCDYYLIIQHSSLYLY